MAVAAPERWTLLIPDYFPPSLNATQRKHWGVIQRHKKAAVDKVHAFALANGGVPKFKGPVELTITRLIGHRQRRWDVDNLWGAVKPLVDALRESKQMANQRGRTTQGGLGIIAEDDPDALELYVGQRKGLAIETLRWLAELGIQTDGPHGLTFGNGSGSGSGTVIELEGDRVA